METDVLVRRSTRLSSRTSEDVRPTKCLSAPREQIKQATEQLAETAYRPVQSLPSSSQRKEDAARVMAEKDGIAQGLVCVLTVVESCHQTRPQQHPECVKSGIGPESGWPGHFVKHALSRFGGIR